MQNLNIAPQGESREALMAEIARLKALAKSMPQGLTLKVSAKGAVSVYGLGRFPVTLYASQWERLLTHAEQIRGFISANQATLATKPQE